MGRYNFEHDENGAFMYLNVRYEGEVQQVRLDYETTSIFTHPKEYKNFDHIFIAMEEGEDSDDETYRTMGAFVWRQLLPDWDDLKNALDAEDFMHIHKPYVAEDDARQYERAGLATPINNVVETKVIEEADDEKIAHEAMADWDSEYDYWLKELYDE